MTTAKEISELILIAESCNQEEIRLLVKTVLSGSLEKYKELDINERTKTLISGLFRGQDIAALKDAFLAVFMTSERYSGNIVKPVFTAPKKYHPSQSTTKDEMLRLFGSAANSIYIFGFWLTGSVKEIVDALCNAADRGVKIIIVADSMDNFVRPLKDGWWGKAHPSMYLIKKTATFSTDTKMHAKTVVVDEKRMLITSANLTHLGLNENLEIGLSVDKGDVTKKVCEFILQVIHDHEYFEKVDWN